MSFKPKQPNRPENDNADKKPFVAIVPEDGLQAVQIGLLVNLGMHKKLPKFAKDNAGKREQDEDGHDKIIVPKEGKDLEQKVAVYVDLLSQTHDYEGEIGVKNIRLPLHPTSRGMSEGINLTTVAPRDPNGNYIKGKPWLLAPASQWQKIASVVKTESGEKVSDIIFKAEYKNTKLNDIGMLLGRPFMFNVEVKEAEKDGNTYVNTKLKSPVPMMKGVAVEPALIKPVSISFDDTDLLNPNEELGCCKYDLLRIADIRKIVLADDYQGSEIQKAIQEREDEDELIKKAKEIAKAILDNDKELKEVLQQLEEREADSAGDAPKQAAKPTAAKPVKPTKVERPVPDNSDDENCPF